jgi:hypothetical protein
MPWGNERADTNNSERIRRRLAYYVHVRTSRRHGDKGEVCKAVGISRDTLRNYAFFNFEPGETKYGPINLDVLIKIADYYGDDISTIMLAAERSTDCRVFDAMLLCDVHAHHRPEVMEALAPTRKAPAPRPEAHENILEMRQRA